MTYSVPIMDPLSRGKQTIWKGWFNNSFGALDLQKKMDLQEYAAVYNVRVEPRDDNIYVIFPSEADAVMFMLRWS